MGDILGFTFLDARMPPQELVKQGYAIEAAISASPGEFQILLRKNNDKVWCFLGGNVVMCANVGFDPIPPAGEIPCKQARPHQICTQTLSREEIARLPEEVNKEFRNPDNYDANSVYKGNNCISFATNLTGHQILRPRSVFTIDGVPGFSESELDTIWNGPMARSCESVNQAIKSRSDLNATPYNGNRCPAGSYLIVPFGGSLIHIIRQLTDGRFIQVMAENHPIQYLMRMQPDRSLVHLTSPYDLEGFVSGAKPCQLMCISPR